MKVLLNNREDFEKWKKYNSHHILIESDEEYPLNYPCIVVNKYIEDYVGDDNFRHCDGKSVIHCYLRKMYLPDGEWQQTSINDIRIAHCRQITESINEKILEKITVKK